MSVPSHTERWRVAAIAHLWDSQSSGEADVFSSGPLRHFLDRREQKSLSMSIKCWINMKEAVLFEVLEKVIA